MKYKLCKRYNVPGDAHCLTFSCYHRLPLLLSETLCGWLVEAINQARSQQAFDVWGYVFMPEHVHVLIMPQRKEYSISDILSAIKRPVAYKAIGRLKATHHTLLRRLLVEGETRTRYRLWQAGGGHDRNLHDASAVRFMLEYIHNNPVRKGLAESAADWRWSSAGDWLGVGEGPLKVDRNLPVLLG